MIPKVSEESDLYCRFCRLNSTKLMFNDFCGRPLTSNFKPRYKNESKAWVSTLKLIFPRSKENLLKINFINHLAYVTVTVCKSHLSARKLVFACEWLIILGFKAFFNLNACLFLTFKSSTKNIISRRHGLVHRYGNDNCLESNYPLFWALNGLLLKCLNNIDENRA